MENFDALRDLKILDEELLATEKSINDTMNQEQVVLKRLEDRTKRPPGELTKDDVEKTLKGELGSLRHFIKQLKNNVQRINLLKEQITKAISRLEDYAHDIIEVMNLDQRRIQARLDGESQPPAGNSPPRVPSESQEMLKSPPENNRIGVSQGPTHVPSKENLLRGLMPTVKSISNISLPKETSQENLLTVMPTVTSITELGLNSRTLEPIREEEEDDEDDDYPVDY